MPFYGSFRKDGRVSQHRGVSCPVSGLSNSALSLLPLSVFVYLSVFLSFSDPPFSLSLPPYILEEIIGELELAFN